MPHAAALTPTAASARPLTVSVETLRHATLWLMIFGGSIVMIKPSPYEVFGIVAMFTWLCSGGARFYRAMVPIILLMLADMTGATITLLKVMHLPETSMWTAIGWYMVFTAIFFMIVLAENPKRRMDIIVHAYVAGAVLCSAIGILGYFHALPSSDSFLLYGRAKGTFDDPNVFGPFLIFPIVVLIQRLYLDGVMRSWRTVFYLAIMLAGLFLSFSRGAWGHAVASIGLMTLMMLWCARRSPALRSRVVLISIGSLFAVAVLIAILLSFQSVREIFTQRASLDQAYDLGKFGRFNRHWMGFALALEKPIGIGIFQFSPMFGEDTHNSYLNAFMSYGWLGGVTWPAIVISSCIVAWTWCLRPSPWRHYFICVVATFQVVVGEAWVIDIDHWRHVWFLFGAVWGLAIATANYTRTLNAAREPARA